MERSDVMSQKTLSQYAMKFDDRCFGWMKDKKYNLIFLKHQENYFNDLLKSRKYLFLRDVLEGLGMTITKDSCLVGWIFEEDNKIGDNFVKFDIREADGSNFFIDFNVDGNIIDRL